MLFFSGATEFPFGIQTAASSSASWDQCRQAGGGAGTIATGCCPAPPTAQAKVSYPVRPGDRVACSVLPPPPLEANPEPIPLDIVYEDDHLIVINKASEATRSARFRGPLSVHW